MRDGSRLAPTPKHDARTWDNWWSTWRGAYALERFVDERERDILREEQ